jgi:hypothetical protein
VIFELIDDMRDCSSDIPSPPAVFAAFDTGAGASGSVGKSRYTTSYIVRNVRTNELGQASYIVELGSIEVFSGLSDWEEFNYHPKVI